jgi:hypothetical protein
MVADQRAAQEWQFVGAIFVKNPSSLESQPKQNQQHPIFKVFADFYRIKEIARQMLPILLRII